MKLCKNFFIETKIMKNLMKKHI